MRGLVVYAVMFFCAVTSVLPTGAAEVAYHCKVEDRFRPLDLENVELGGHVGRQIDTCIIGRLAPAEIRQRLAGEIVPPFKKRNEERTWRGEFWGKWFTSALWAAEYGGNRDLLRFLDAQVDRIIAAQGDDGYLGTYAERITGRWDLWCQRYTLLGLLAYYKETGNRGALEAAKRQVDYLIRHVGPEPGKEPITHLGIMYGIPACDVLEPVGMLYQLTGDERYLDLAEYILRDLGRYPSLDPVRRAMEDVPMAAVPDPSYFEGKRGDGKSPHAYATMALYDGIAEVYRATGREKLREVLVKACENIIRTELFITGGVGAHEFYSGRDRQTGDTVHTMETCAGWAWMHLCANILRLTGEPRWADRIEQVFYNHLLGAMKPDGTWWTYRNGLAGRKLPARPQCGLETMQCCVANGPRAMLLFPALAVMNSDEGPVVNFYCQGTYDVPLSGNRSVRIEQQTDYPVTGDVRLRLEVEEPTGFTLRLRIPAWSRRTTLAINGQKERRPETGRYAALERVWKPDDTIDLHLDVGGRVVASPGSKDHVAVLHGPVVLARDMRLEGDSGDAFMRAPASLDTTDNGYIGLEPVESPEGIWMAFRAPLTDGGGLEMCDYASAGNTWDGKSAFRVWLPAASRTPACGAGLMPEPTGARPNAELLASIQARMRRQAVMVDEVVIGSRASEEQHDFRGEKILAGTYNGRAYHGARDGGWISYEMEVLPDRPVKLVCTYWGSDGGKRTFDILVEGEKIATVSLDEEKPGEFFTVDYSVPEGLTRGKKKVTVKFDGHPGNTVGGLYGCWTARREP